jgi:transposase
MRQITREERGKSKEARERLNQNPSNSSRPPSSQAPWENGWEPSQDSAEDEDVSQGATSDKSGDGKNAGEAQNEQKDEAKASAPKADRGEPKQGRPGRPEGAPGYSRTQKLAVDKECVHRCSACGAALEEGCEQHAKMSSSVGRVAGVMIKAHCTTKAERRRCASELQ